MLIILAEHGNVVIRKVSNGINILNLQRRTEHQKSKHNTALELGLGLSYLLVWSIASKFSCRMREHATKVCVLALVFYEGVQLRSSQLCSLYSHDGTYNKGSIQIHFSIRCLLLWLEGEIIELLAESMSRTWDEKSSNC
jgi:hypothetical protein